MASVQSLAQTANIVTGIILYYLLLDEKPTVLGIMSAVMCICGVIFVIQPDFIFINKESRNNSMVFKSEDKEQ